MALKALETDSTDMNITSFLMANIAYANSHLGNPEKAVAYFEKHGALLFERATKEFQISLSEMEVKFDVEKKELKINALEYEKRMILWLSMLGGALLLLALAHLIARHRLAVSKRKLAEQQVLRLEQEKQLAQTKAALEDEITERTQQAKNLHDGLESMLSDVQSNLLDLKKGAVIVSDDAVRFNQTLATLLDSIAELRRGALNMMPAHEQAKISKPLFDKIHEGLAELLERQEIYCKPDLRLDDLAGMLFTNKTYVSLVINEAYQTGFYVLMNRYRVKKAVRLMGDKSMQIKDIWIQSGFNSQSSFNAIFRKEMGMTPLEWKKKGNTVGIE